MATDQAFREMALDLPEAQEKAHFGKADFRVRNKIFAGFNAGGLAYVKLKAEEQDMVCHSEGHSVIRPISGGWGLKGWTEINHEKADDALLKSLLKMAWANTAPPSLLKSIAKKEED